MDFEISKKSIGFFYYKGALDENDLSAYKEKLSEFNTYMITYDKTGQINASSQDFINMFCFIFTVSFVQNILTNGAYDVLKSLMIWIWNSISDKKLHFISARKILEKDITFGLEINFNKKRKLTIRLTGDVTDDQKNECIDKAFELIQNQMNLENNNESSINNSPFGKEFFATYNYEKQQYEVKDAFEELYNKHCKK